MYTSEIEAFLDDNCWPNLPNMRNIRTARKIKQDKYIKIINYTTNNVCFDIIAVKFFCKGKYNGKEIAELIDKDYAPKTGKNVNVLKFFDNQECIIVKESITGEKTVRFFYPTYNTNTLTSKYNWQSTRAQAITFLEGVTIINRIYERKTSSNNNIYYMICLV